VLIAFQKNGLRFQNKKIAKKVFDNAGKLLSSAKVKTLGELNNIFKRKCILNYQITDHRSKII